MMETAQAETVPFEKGAVREYLDGCIRAARERRRLHMRHAPGRVLVEIGAIDAFQSVRASLFGEMLPRGEEEHA